MISESISTNVYGIEPGISGSSVRRAAQSGRCGKERCFLGLPPAVVSSHARRASVIAESQVYVSPPPWPRIRYFNAF